MNILYPLKENVCKIFYHYSSFLFPSQKTNTADCGVTMLLCHGDVTMAIYCLQSLFYQLGHALPILFIDDGSLTASDYKKLKKYFTATFEKKSRALFKINKQYSSFPTFLRYLNDPATHIKKMKFLGLFLSPFKQIIYLEPDMLFVQKPQEIHTFRTSSVNYYGTLREDIVELFVKENYSDIILRKLLYSQLKINAHFLFNAGLMLIHKKTLNSRTLNQIEKTLKVAYAIDYCRFANFDEALLATLFDMKKSKLLPNGRYFNVADYNEYKNLKETGALADVAMFHFTTYARKIILYQSIKLTVKTHFFHKT